MTTELNTLDERARQVIITTLGVQAPIDPATEIRRRIDFLKTYLRTSGQRGFVLGISGGQDSALAGRLVQLAVDEIQYEKGATAATFTAMRLPYGAQADEADAVLALEFIKPDRVVTYDIKPAVDAFKAVYDAADAPLSDYTKGNTKARLRMSAQYAYAGEHGCLVIGTDHAAEAVTGFFTKFGDGGADILPLSGLTKRQGRALLEALGAPERLYVKAPTADLLDEFAGRADEDELGVTYGEIDDFLEGLPVDTSIATLLINRYNVTAHKRDAPVSPN